MEKRECDDSISIAVETAAMREGILSLYYVRICDVNREDARGCSKPMTMHRIFALFVVAIAGVLQCDAQAGRASSPAASPEGGDNKKELMRFVWPTLKAAGKSGWVYFNGICTLSEKFHDYRVTVPQLNLQSPPTAKSALETIREVFRGDNSVVVSEDTFGIIRIRVGDVSEAILQTKISKIRFEPLERYDPISPILAIERASEVEVAMRKLQLRVPSKIIDILTPGPAPELPHVPREITGVTMEQALDVVGTTFKGVILYGSCDKEYVFDITFTGGINFDDDSLKKSDNPQR